MAKKVFKVKTIASAIAALAASAAPIPAGATVTTDADQAPGNSLNKFGDEGAGANSNVIVTAGEHLLGFTVATRSDGTVFAQHDSHASHSSHSSHSSHHSSSF
jgi:hypothetical protein